MNDRDFEAEAKKLRETSAKEEINTAELNCGMEKQEIQKRFGAFAGPLYPNRYAEIGIKKAKNGYILTCGMETYVFSDLEAVVGYLKGFYDK